MFSFTLSRSGRASRFLRLQHSCALEQCKKHAEAAERIVLAGHALEKGGYIGSFSSTGIHQIATQRPSLQTLSSRPFLAHGRRYISTSVRLKNAEPVYFRLLPESNMASLTPPQSPPRWNHTPEEVIRLTKDAISRNKAVSDQVAGLLPADCNFDTVSSPAEPRIEFDFIPVDLLGICKWSWGT